MNASIRKFLKEEDGVTALEYGLLAAVIAGILIAVGNKEIRVLRDAVQEPLRPCHQGLRVGTCDQWWRLSLRASIPAVLGCATAAGVQ
jgi:Flp pilus assembly pilin Flp